MPFCLFVMRRLNSVQLLIPGIQCDMRLYARKSCNAQYDLFPTVSDSRFQVGPIVCWLWLDRNVTVHGREIAADVKIYMVNVLKF